MTIDEQGFLSPDIQAWIGKHRTENRAWFALAEDLNRIGQRQLALQNIPADDNQAFLTALLFMRGLSGFQGAILLVERGMTQEARTLTRGCFETVFCLGAVRKDPAFADAFVRDDASRRQKLARLLLKLPDDSSGLDAGHIEKLNGFLDDLAQSGLQSEPLQIARAAELAGLTDIYDTYYRSLSNDAAHPSVTALNRHVSADESGLIKGLRWGPDVTDVEDTLMVACTGAVYVIYLAKAVLNREDTSEGLDRCWAEYKRLIGVKTGATA